MRKNTTAPRPPWRTFALAIAPVLSMMLPLVGQGAEPAPPRPEADRAAQGGEVSTDAAALQTALAAVRDAMQEARWADASTGLAAILERFKGTDLARRMRNEIVAFDRRCRFHTVYTAPEWQDLVHGEILRYSPNTGELRIRYTPETMADFKYVDELGPKPEQPPGLRPTILPPPRTAADYRFHPAVFQEYKVTVTGTSYSRTSFLVCVNGDSAHEIEVGVPPFSRAVDFVSPEVNPRDYPSTRVSWIPTAILRRSGKEEFKLLTKKEWGAERRPPKDLTNLNEAEKWYSRAVRYPVEDGEKFKLVVAVSATRITLKSGSRTMVSCNKARNEHGMFAVRGAKFSHLDIVGKVDHAWLQNKLDTHRNAALARFERGYVANKVLPAWLFEPLAAVAEAGAEAAAGEDSPYPGEHCPDAEKWSAAIEGLTAHNYRTVLFGLTFTSDRDLSKTVKAYLRARACLGLGMLEEAATAAAAAYEGDQAYYWTPLVMALVLDQQGQHEAAAKWFSRAIALQPRRADAYAWLADSLLSRGLHVQAEAVFQQATTAGASSEHLVHVGATLGKIKHGPDWERRFTVETPHFRIDSDIDERTCRDAGLVLERAYDFYHNVLGKIDTAGRRFQVYVFSGRAGFDRYCSGLRMDVPVHTAGLYVPRLKQLLIWNLANRAEMLRTIRHEGLHQYVDVLLKGPPTWLNEGMAEYFEQSRFERGKPVAGLIQERHLRQLALIRGGSRPDLGELMRLPHQAFYLKPQVHYPMSWALVHFLRHTTRVNRKIFDALLDGLRAGKPYAAVLKQALAGVDAKAMDAEFWEYVKQLRAR